MLIDITLSDAGSLASLISLALTGWVAFRVGRIEKRYLARARGPELANRLKMHGTRLVGFLNEPEAFQNEIASELIAAEVTVASLKKKFSGESKRSSKRLLLSIRDAQSATGDQMRLRRVYLDLSRLLEQIADQLADETWEH